MEHVDVPTVEMKMKPARGYATKRRTGRDHRQGDMDPWRAVPGQQVVPEASAMLVRVAGMAGSFTYASTVSACYETDCIDKGTVAERRITSDRRRVVWSGHKLAMQ